MKAALVLQQVDKATLICAGELPAIMEGLRTPGGALLLLSVANPEGESSGEVVVVPSAQILRVELAAEVVREMLGTDLR